MIAISSFRPFSKCSPDRQEDFVRAKRSWDTAFSATHYFNAPEPRLDGARTIFVSRDNPDDRPQISVVAAHASRQPEWVALINADIVVGAGMSMAEYALEKWAAVCAISRRVVWPDGRKPEDWGLDFFCAKPQVWLAVMNQIPQKFTLGRIRFDTWLCTFFAKRYEEQCYDLTQNRLIFHPVHGEREDQNMDDPDNYYLRHPAYPKKRLRL